MVQLTNTLGTQNLKKQHITNTLQWYTLDNRISTLIVHRISRAALQSQEVMVHITNTLDTQNLEGHCNSIANKHPGYTESQGKLQWYSKQTPWVHRISRSTAMV